MSVQINASQSICSPQLGIYPRNKSIHYLNSRCQSSLVLIFTFSINFLNKNLPRWTTNLQRFVFLFLKMQKMFFRRWQIFGWQFMAESSIWCLAVLDLFVCLSLNWVSALKLAVAVYFDGLAALLLDFRALAWGVRLVWNFILKITVVTSLLIFSPFYMNIFCLLYSSFFLSVFVFYWDR